MNLRWRRSAFTVAALGLVVGCFLPLSPEVEGVFFSISALLVMTLVAAILCAAAAWLPLRPSIAAGLIAVLVACDVTLAMLQVPEIAGDAATGFWLLVLANWLAAGLCVAQLASLDPRGKVARRALDLAIPLLFGVFVIYLWEVTVRGFGVPSVLMPSPSATAARFVAALPTLGEDFV